MDASSSPGAERLAGRAEGAGDRQRLVTWLSAKQVPWHRHTFWYLWGSILLVLFACQVVTGLALMLYYDPGDGAHGSVQQIATWVDFGWLVRSLHVWGSRLLAGAMLVHLFSTLFLRAYRKPREPTWWSGCVLGALCLVAVFTGRLLPMDEVAYSATRIALKMLEGLPLVGGGLAELVRGGTGIGELTVRRFYVFHVALIPLFTALLGVAHVAMVWVHGSAVPPGLSGQSRTVRFYPDFVRVEAAVWLLVLAALAVLAIEFVPELGPAADPLAPTALGIQPEWVFLPFFQALRVTGQLLGGGWGSVVGMATSAALVLGLLALPLIDMGEGRPVRARIAQLFGLVLLVSYAGLLVWGLIG